MTLPKRTKHYKGGNRKGMYTNFADTERRDFQKKMYRAFCIKCQRRTPHNFLGCTQHKEENLGESDDRDTD